MPALKEEERVAPDGEQTNEIGIDCPIDDLKVHTLSTLYNIRVPLIHF